MKKFYFTFGAGQKYEGFAQPIEADTEISAREIMLTVYSTNWSFIYTEEKWLLMKNNPNLPFKLEEELPLISQSDFTNNETIEE